MVGAGGGHDDGLRTEESLSGGVDVWSDAVSSHAPDHLLVMVHGILGRSAPTPLPAWVLTLLSVQHFLFCFAGELVQEFHRTARARAGDGVRILVFAY